MLKKCQPCSLGAARELADFEKIWMEFPGAWTLFATSARGAIGDRRCCEVRQCSTKKRIKSSDVMSVEEASLRRKRSLHTLVSLIAKASTVGVVVVWLIILKEYLWLGLTLAKKCSLIFVGKMCTALQGETGTPCVSCRARRKFCCIVPVGFLCFVFRSFFHLKEGDAQVRG